MALDKTTLQSTLQAIFEDDGGNTAANVASRMADAIDTFVKSGTVNVTSTGATGSGTPGGPLPIAGLPGTGSVT